MPAAWARAAHAANVHVRALACVDKGTSRDRAIPRSHWQREDCNGNVVSRSRCRLSPGKLLVSMQQCGLDCVAGYYCPTPATDRSPRAVECPEGSYCPANATAPSASVRVARPAMTLLRSWQGCLW
jgi:hypothetical protein